ncbi:MAG: hypothetical protein QF773_05390, partial [Lentisphaeria bacterium]|nr:hypothetical protein [Lentisphaeria bacterium]
DERLLAAVGGGSIHFCGNGEHLIETMLEIPRLHGIDVGESAALDIDRVYACCRARRVAVTNIRPGRAALTDGEAVKRFPTGAVFVYTTEDIADAQEVIAAYKSEDC